MKYAIVTGASRGIGYETVLKLAGEGCLVFAVSRNKEALDKLKQAAIADHVIPIIADIATTQGLQEVFNSVSAQTKELHIVINNAAQQLNKPFKAHSITDFEQLLKVNTIMPAMLINICLPLLSKARGAHVVNIGSMAGFQGSVKFVGISAYSASKAALANLTECLAQELMAEGISVNCLALGAVQTDMLQASIPGAKTTQTAENIGDYIAWFALNGQRYFNGKILPVATSTP